MVQITLVLDISKLAELAAHRSTSVTRILATDSAATQELLLAYTAPRRPRELPDALFFRNIISLR